MNTRLTPIKAIRKNCLDCSGGSVSEVRNCVIKECPLFEYRHGKNPNRKRKVLQEVVHFENVS